ncbi:natterin-3-like [Cebidichthys violaceus]|uniref:natterin-3-like n=1 Tax=Cebidichthys violaceus TaxID=271503 RepID=UPI0035CC4CB4
MKLSVLLMLALPALTSAGLDSCEKYNKPVLFLDPNLEDIVPIITDTGTANQAIPTRVGIENYSEKDLQLNNNQTNLEWQTFNGSLPNGAVSIYNGYVKRTDYVCQFWYNSGFYNPGMDSIPYCHYTHGGSGFVGTPFQILVNKDNFEFLEWKEGYDGSVPPNSVKTCTTCQRYVGKNMYGLGKVDVEDKVFYLPWSGSEYWYRSYQVLTFSKDVYKEHLSDVKYKTDGIKPIEYPPETMRKSAITNRGCQTVTGTASLSKMNKVDQTWETTFSITAGAQISMTAKLPLIAETEIQLSASMTFQFTKGTTYSESNTHTLSVTHNVPPNHSCGVSMVGYQYGADIPFTASVSRTYSNGETTWTSISGTYKSVQMAEVRSVVDPCEPLPDPTPCP